MLRLSFQRPVFPGDRSKEEADHGQEVTSRCHLGPELGKGRMCRNSPGQEYLPNPVIRGNPEEIEENGSRRGLGQAVHIEKLF